MKISKIEKKDGIYYVTLIPNFFERIFNFKEKVEKYKETGMTYTFGGGTVYIKDDGTKTSNGDKVGEAIDKWNRAWN